MPILEQLCGNGTNQQKTLKLQTNAPIMVQSSCNSLVILDACQTWKRKRRRRKTKKKNPGSLLAEEGKMRYFSLFSTTFFHYIASIKLTFMLFTPNHKILMLSCNTLLNSHPKNKRHQLILYLPVGSQKHIYCLW